MEPFLPSPIESKIIESFVRDKQAETGILSVKTGISFFEKRNALIKKISVINSLSIVIKARRINFLFCQESFLPKSIKINEIIIESCRGWRLVWRIAICSHIQRKHLPITLSAFG